ncbi:MAG: hypothetical protein V3U88_10830 [Methylococcales bacterium]
MLPAGVEASRACDSRWGADSVGSGLQAFWKPALKYLAWYCCGNAEDGQHDKLQTCME